MKTLSIVLLPGDGIGPEVMAEAVQTLNVLAPAMPDVRLDLTTHAVGAGAYRDSGDPLPESALEACRNADAVLLGAMGLPSVRWPDGREMAPQLDLRERLALAR